MNANMLKATVAVIILGGAVAAYFYLQQSKPETVPSAPPPQITQAVKAPVAQVIVAPPSTNPLPGLNESDSYMLDALAELISNKTLMQLFHTERIIRNIVATIDNLPQMKLPSRILPVEQPSGKFIAAMDASELVISPKNAARYTPYINLAEAFDTKQLVGLYVRLYPLFQQAYAELGYPNKYFNDRVLEVLDDLLDAPDIKEPVKLVRPEVYYLFADSDLEELPIGQRILMRTGSKNEATLKAKLLAIKQELKLHLQDKKLGQTEQ
jgi:hypothetical protein